jgi:GNAT superfamily N-acetyltransferase
METGWELRIGPDEQAEELVTTRLVDHNTHSSPIVRERFEPQHLRSRPLAVYAYQDDRLVGGCTGSTEDLWQWFTVDLMWVDEGLRGRGLGRRMLEAAEDEARGRGCRWAKLNTWDFQAPAFYEGCGYREYGREVDYPPGHTNFLLRKDLVAPLQDGR